MSLLAVRDAIGDARRQIADLFLGLEDKGRFRRYVTGTGQVLDHTHEVTADCFRRGCVIHCPTDHAMKDFRTHWRSDRALMERICPHGIGHPDPDHLTFVQEGRGEEAADAESVHGCDGCCRGAYGPRMSDDG